MIPLDRRNRPPVKDVYALLCTHQGLLVHFSGTPKMVGLEPRYWYPEDLKNVLKGDADGGVSASVVMPGDTFEIDNSNAAGNIGLILGFRTRLSLIEAHRKDGGSLLDLETRRRLCRQPNLDIADLNNTIVEREPGRYNEWAVADFETLGVLAISPFTYEKPAAIGDIKGADETPPHLLGSNSGADFGRSSLEEIRDIFHSQPIYTLKTDGIYQYKNGSLSRVRHEEIYRAS